MGDPAEVYQDIANTVGRISTRSHARSVDGKFQTALGRTRSKLNALLKLGAFRSAVGPVQGGGWSQKIVLTAMQRLHGYTRRAGVTPLALFQQMDDDASGTVDQQEFRAGLAKLGLKFDNECIAEVMKYMDKDGGGSIDYQEFVAKMEELAEREASTGKAVLSALSNKLLSSGITLRELFDKIDVDGSGELDAVEFHAALVSAGLKVSKEGSSRALAELDVDGSGTLTIVELTRHMAEFQRKRRVFANSVLSRVVKFVERTNTSVARLFSKVDSDGSGDLDVLELQEALRKMRVDLNEVEVEEIMLELDLFLQPAEQLADASSKDEAAELSVSLAQFLDKMNIFQKEYNMDTDKCAELFKQFDSDSSGYLEKDEVRQLAEHLGLAEQIREDSKFVGRMISEIEGTRENPEEVADEQEHDGQVNYQEFLSWFMVEGRSYLPRREYSAAGEMENLTREQLRALFDRLDDDNSSYINLAEAWAGAHATWPLLDRQSCEAAFRASDSNGTGEINFTDFQTLVHCLEYLNQKRHLLQEVRAQFAESGMDDDGLYIALTILGVDVNDMELTAIFFAALDAATSSEGGQQSNRLAVADFIPWLLGHEVCHRLLVNKREAWMHAELNKRAATNLHGSLYFEDVAGTVFSSRKVNAELPDTLYGNVVQKVKSATSESAERKMYLEKGLTNALGRIDSLPTLTEGIILELAQACTKESYFEGQHIFTQGEENDAFYVVRRGKIEVLTDGDVIEEGVGAGSGIGEVGLLFATRRNVTARCTAPTEMFVLDRASFHTALSVLPPDERVGKLEKVLQKFWLLVSRAELGHPKTEEIGFQVYRMLHMRTAKSLMMADETEDFDENEERKIAGSDWTEDCKRYGLEANGCLTSTMFFDSMYQLVDLWAGDMNVKFCTFLSTLFNNVAAWDYTDNPEPMWKFKPLEAVGCIGEEFEQIKEDARMADMEAKRAADEAAAEAEQARLDWEADREAKRLRVQMATMSRQARHAHMNRVGELQSQVLDLDNASDLLRRQLASPGSRTQTVQTVTKAALGVLTLTAGSCALPSGTRLKDCNVTPGAADTVGKLINNEAAVYVKVTGTADAYELYTDAGLTTALETSGVTGAGGTGGTIEVDLPDDMRNGGLSDEEREALLQQLAENEQKRARLLTCVYDAEAAELLRRHGTDEMSDEDREALLQQVAAVKLDRLALQEEAADSEEVEIARKMPLSTYWTADEKVAMNTRREQLQLARHQITLDRLEQQQKELARRLAVAAKSRGLGVSSYWSEEEVAKMKTQRTKLREERKAVLAFDPVAAGRSNASLNSVSGGGAGEEEVNCRVDSTGMATGLLPAVVKLDTKGQLESSHKPQPRLPFMPMSPRWSPSRHAVCGWTIGHKTQHHHVGKRLGVKWLVGSNVPVQQPATPRLPVTPRYSSPRLPQAGSPRISGAMAGSVHGPPRGGGWVPQWMGSLGYSNADLRQYNTMLEPGRGYTSARAMLLSKHRPDQSGSARQAIRPVDSVESVDSVFSKYTMPIMSARPPRTGYGQRKAVREFLSSGKGLGR